MSTPSYRYIFALISALAVLPAATSAHGKQSKLVFSCETANHKFVKVYDNESTISYTFGKKGAKPELSLSVPRSAASTDQWSGFGRYESYSVTIPNGDVTYSVFYGFDTRDEDSEINAGIVVKTGKGKETTILCNIKTLHQNIDGINLKADKY